MNEFKSGFLHQVSELCQKKEEDETVLFIVFISLASWVHHTLGHFDVKNSNSKGLQNYLWISIKILKNNIPRIFLLCVTHEPFA